MTPAKGQSSSRHKGKEIVSDSPIVRNVGEETVYSESNHSNEEEEPCALLLLILDTISIPISVRFLVIIRRHY